MDQAPATKTSRYVSMVVVAAIYHPPNAATADTLIDHLLHSMDAIASTHPETGFTLLGDYNELNILMLTANRGFRQVVSVPTRGDQILDKIVTNMSGYYNSPTTLPPLGSSDHLAVSWIPTQYSPKTNQRQCYSRIWTDSPELSAGFHGRFEQMERTEEQSK